MARFLVLIAQDAEPGLRHIYEGHVRQPMLGFWSLMITRFVLTIVAPFLLGA
jgi:hypothetical protein